jgi:hypothetical protein
MDQEVSLSRRAAVAVRRSLASGPKVDERTRYVCEVCDKKHANYHSHVEHGLCEECRDADFERMRQSLTCCRCGAKVEKLTPSGARPLGERKNRFISCPTCGLVIAADINSNG